MALILNSDTLLSVSGAAKDIGVSRQYLYQCIKRRDVPVIRIAGHLFLDPTAVDLIKKGGKA
jgi:hypothetical protein